MTNRATRLEVSQGHKHGTIPYVRYGFLLVSCYSNIVDFKKCRDLEIWVRGHLRSLKVVPFDRWFPIVTVVI